MSIKKRVNLDGKKVIKYCDLDHGILNNDSVAYAKHALGEVYGVLDACHMLKLMRNLLAEKQRIRDGEGRVVAWKYIEALGSLQQQQGLHAANKLRKQHIDFKSRMMKASLAGQPLSRCLLTRKLSHDHLELLFATLRNRTGNNDNPTVLEFRSAYRKCLVVIVLPSTPGNCQVDGKATLFDRLSVKEARQEMKLPGAKPNVSDDTLRAALGAYGKVLGFRPSLYTGTRHLRMEMTNSVPNFLIVAGNRVMCEYRSIKRVCARCSLEGHFGAAYHTPRCNRCGTFGHNTKGCSSPCRRCGYNHATTGLHLSTELLSGFPCRPSRARWTPNKRGEFG
ncbi:hypothetical protein HPB47_007694 [Ixodes persulcatus]|uniref:Uncharacterized protein n=1 Tax=Ixodes persulcatus TaxID=34615 RepID=A0AC60P742_IXOPE|nr:hypothetical protein HPB47_007694 [Ixodes persulcatus]